MSLTFNGTSSNLQIASRLIPAAYPFTEFCWVKPRISTQSTFALSTGSSDNAEEFGAYVDGGNTGKVRGWAAHTANNGTVNSTSNVVTSWQPMMIVHNSATSCDVYYAAGAKVNGSTAQPPNFASMTRFAVGARAGTLNFWFDGDIAEVAVWSSGLVQADYDSLAAGAAPETIQAASLVESWSLLTQATTQVGTKGATLTNGASTTQGGTHPITRAASGTTISTTPGNAAATGAPATIQGTVTIATAPGNAAATGAPATITNGSTTTTITTTPGNAAATGATASVGTYIQTDVMPNNTELSILANTAVVWTWTPSGRVGSMVGLTPVDGTGTTDANGRLAPGIALASGRLSVAVRNASAKQDDIFEQYY